MSRELTGRISTSPESVTDGDLVLQANRVPSAWASWLTIDDGRTVEEYVNDNSKSNTSSSSHALKQSKISTSHAAIRSSDSHDSAALRRSATCTHGTFHSRTLHRPNGANSERTRSSSQTPAIRRSSSGTCKSSSAYMQHYPNQRLKLVYGQRWNRSKTPLAPKTEALLRAVGIYPSTEGNEIAHGNNKENICKTSSAGINIGFRHLSFSFTSDESQEYDKHLVKRKSKLSAFFRSRKSAG
mmetsp:Transcript_14775/g.18269  ORF Transcript_14775/g.18269 Transcript_14775/m.18269 type:complete len:241 (+) Transcript_14775:278-1000(+)